MKSDEIKVLAPSFNIALRLSNEGPVFSTRDLKQFSQKPDHHYRIGPLPSKKYIEPLSLIMDILNGKTTLFTPEIIKRTLAPPEEYAPESLLFITGYWKSSLAKQHNFDVFTYDRLRILSTEIRRILDEKRTVTLRFGPKLWLKSEQLREILKWV
ncbi:MAG: hypothetical protein V3R45_09495 [Candidatus Aminicenantaceae bacterium]